MISAVNTFQIGDIEMRDIDTNRGRETVKIRRIIIQDLSNPLTELKSHYGGKFRRP